MYYEGGKGLAQDYTEAVKWYRLAANKGEAAAQASLGGMYQSGYGVQQDYREALRWYRLAVDQGDPNALASMGFLYEWGNGVLQDNVQAHMWYNLAAANGFAHAAELRDTVARKMTVEQIAEGQRLAREWKPKTQP
jgi:TPR repeat protein